MPPRDRPPPSRVACRVCGKDDVDERAQVDLHMRCVEKATNRALERSRRAPKAEPEAAAAGRTLGHAELVRRLAAERAPLVQAAAPRHRRSAGTSADESDDDGPALTGEESAAVESLSRGGGLSTGGLGADGFDDA